jgi:hypothetical protein
MEPSTTSAPAGFSVGAVFAAALLAVGFQSMVHSVRLPLTALAAFLIRRSYPDPTALDAVNIVWVVQISYALIGVILAAAGLGLGGWLRSDSSRKERQAIESPRHRRGL